MADQEAPQRTASIRSVASKSSCASGVSLTRQARTRKRAKTVTGASSTRVETTSKSPVSELPWPADSVTQEPLPSILSTQKTVQGAPPRPNRSPHRITGEVAKAVLVGDGAFEVSRQNGKPAMTSLVVEEIRTHHGAAKLTRQTSGMQILPTASRPEPPLSAFSRDPELTGIDPTSVNMRDSVSTRVSRQSSLYPQSHSTTSDTDLPPSPQSMIDDNDRYDPSYDPVVNETQMYDGDDVSYRLQLLVNNNYFLPPAHSKPSAADFAAMEKTVQKKPSIPTFFERLRGRSKSKPPTPTGTLSSSFNPTGPALRTTADSITTAQLLRPQPLRGSTQSSRGHPEARTGRVVVVREKMEDLAIAAKQAEQEMKARALRRDQGPQNERTRVTDVIDPTDTVDLPPPSSNYPFAVQASALHGLGVQDSLGAALLADRLPPPHSPDMSASDPDDRWRKALLHEAVHHSLDNTPDTSFSMLQATSTPLASPLTGSSQAPRALEFSSIPLLDQRIVNNSGSSDRSPSVISKKKSSQSVANTSSSKSRSKRPGIGKLSPNDSSVGVPPLRSTTPSEPLTPLTPAPRRHVINLSHSTSQGELENHVQATEGSSRAGLRKTVSSPSLSETYDSDARNLAQTPPPLPRPAQSFVSFSELQEKPSRMTLQSFTTEHDHDLVDGDRTPRISLEGRPSLSLSDYSQPSPTMSAFRDAPPPDMTDDNVDQAQWQRSVEILPMNESPVPRYSATSPPPRISSSLTYFALSPPPRSSPINYQIRSTPSPRVFENDHTPQQHSTPLVDDTPLIITDAEPTPPTFPLLQRRGLPNGMQLSLEIPPTNIAVAIHSAPAPSSPTTFFDVIQSQPSALDDLESSDESDSETDVTQLSASDPGSDSPIAPPPSQSPLMRLGNHSTPYISIRHARNETPRPSTGIKDKKPIGNIPVRAPFFQERGGKSDQGHGPPVSSFDFYKYTQQNGTATEGPRSSDITGKRRSTVGNVSAWKTMNPKAQESLRKLDGMLIQHMAAERDTIKRIAATARARSNSNIHIPVERGS